MSIRLKDTIYDLVNKATKDGSGNTITSTYLKLSGGEMTGNITLDYKDSTNKSYIILKNGRANSGAGNWAINMYEMQNIDETIISRIGGYGTGTSLEYVFIGHNGYSGNNLRVYSDKVTFGSSQLAYTTSNVSSATKLQTARTIWGQSFNGTSNVSGNMTGVGTISMSGALTLTGTDSTTALISFSRPNYNYITFPTGYSLAFGIATGSASTLYRMTDEAFIPERTNEVSLGTSSLKWKNIYATTFTGDLSGNASSAEYSTYIRITSTNPTSTTTYNPIWVANSSATSDGSNNYTPRANDGFSYRTREGSTSTIGYGIAVLGNSIAEGTVGNKYGVLRLYSRSSGYLDIAAGTDSTNNYSIYLPTITKTSQFVCHENDTQIGGPAQPVYVTAAGEIGACSISAGTASSNRCLMVTNGSNGMYYTPSITGNYLNGALISTVSDTTTVRHTCTNSNGSVSLYAATNRGLYDSTNSAWIIYLTTAADHVYVPKWESKGSSTAPVYFNSSGEPAQGSTYAGGTKVTLNGTAKGASTASFYAPTGAGTNGQFLQSTGGTPSWVTLNYWSTTVTRTANTVLAAPNGSDGTATFRKLVSADLPTMYWANVAISSSSSTTKAPTFASVSLGKTDTYGAIYMLRDSANYVKCGSTEGGSGYFAVVPGGQGVSIAAADLIVATDCVYPGTTSVTTLGTSSKTWKNTYTDIVTTPKVYYSGALVIDGTSEVQLKYNNTNAQSVVLTSTAFKPFTSATGNVMLGNYASLWKGLYTSVSTSSTLNKLGINYCDSNGYILSTISCGTSAVGIYSTGTIYLRGGCTKSTSTNTIPSSSGTGVVIDASGNASANSFTSTVATGTIPITVTSTTKCTNLNADLWDGYNLSVVTSVPSSPSSTTIYIVT